MEFPRETQDLQEEIVMKEEGPVRNLAATEDLNAVAIVIAEEEIAEVVVIVVEAVETVEMIGFQRIRTRPKRY